MYNNGQWVPPYHLQKKGLNYDVFNLVDPNTNPDVDLPETYATRSESWSTAIFSILSHPGTLPLGEGQKLLKSCCTVMKFPLELFQLHPIQNGNSFDFQGI